VTNAGAAKDKRVLRYASNAKAGDAQSIKYLLNAVFTGPDGTLTSLPTTIFAGEVKIRDVTEGKIRYLFNASEIDARDVLNQNKSAAEMKGRLQVLRGLTIEGVMSPDGQLTQNQIVLPSAPPAAADVIREMLTMMPTPLALPTAPVGNGATWTVTRPFSTNGIELTLVYTCKAAFTSATVATITATTAVQGKAQQIAADASISAVTGTGSLTLQLDTSKLFGTQQETIAPELTLLQGAATAKISMKFSPGIEVVK
jgi:hypothetical protein